MEKLIITAAIVGDSTTRSKNPYVPMTPSEIAESAIESYHSGAAVCHIHVRDPKTHEPSMQFDLYQEVVERIRDKCEMLINLTTGQGGGMYYNPEASGKPWDISRLKNPEERIEHVLKLKPELCSLDVGTLNFGNNAFVNFVGITEKMAAMIQEAGTKPELEVFDIGHIRFGNYLIEKGLIEKPPLFQFCLGVPWGIEAKFENCVFMRKQIPYEAVWSAFGIGPQSYPIAIASIIMGGHVRVGYEDNIYVKKGVLSTSNAQMVRKVVEISSHLEREIASSKEARKILGLNKRVDIT